jgi:hypothetical protein
MLISRLCPTLGDYALHFEIQVRSSSAKKNVLESTRGVNQET